LSAMRSQKMAQTDLYSLTERELTGHWVAVEQRPHGSSGFRNLPPGAVLVDYDSELDLLCQRVAAAGLKRLTIFKYEGHYPDSSDDSYRGSRGSA